jgi:hypothetical protein
MITIEAKELKRFFKKILNRKKIKKAVSNSLFNATAEEASFDKKNHAFKSSADAILENGIDFVVKNLSSSIFVDTAKVKYAGFVYDGTKPHEIKPKGNGSLSWASGGNRFFAKGVMHPGYKGDPWIETNFEKRFKIFGKNLTNELVDEIEEIIK